MFVLLNFTAFVYCLTSRTLVGSLWLYSTRSVHRKMCETCQSLKQPPVSWLWWTVTPRSCLVRSVSQSHLHNLLPITLFNQVLQCLSLGGQCSGIREKCCQNCCGVVVILWLFSGSEVYLPDSALHGAMLIGSLTRNFRHFWWCNLGLILNK